MGVAATIASGGNVWLGLQVYSFWSSGINAAISGDMGSFAAGFGASVALGAAGRWAAIGLGGAMLESAKSFAGGFAIGAVEFGLSGFGAGFASSYAGGASFSDAMEAGGRGALIGAAVGGVIEGSYMAGWQNSLHGASRQDVYKAGVKHMRSLTISRTDRFGVTVGARKAVGPFGHRYIRTQTGGFEAGPDDNWNMKVNPAKTVATTDSYIASGDVTSTSVGLSRSGLNEMTSYYKCMWEGSPYTGTYNSNYAVNSVIYGSGGDVPQNLGWTPQFAAHVYWGGNKK